MSEPAPSPPSGSPTAPTASTGEMSEEKWKRRQFYLSIISTVVLVFGGLGGIYQYSAQQKKLADDQLEQQKKDAAAREEAAKKDRDQREKLANRDIAQREKEADLRKREIALMIYREKKEAYGLLVDAATAITTANNRREVEDRAGKFYGVYYGRVHIIPELDSAVQDAKNAFKKKLDDYLATSNSDPPLQVFNSQLYDMAEACRKGLDCRSLDKEK